MNDYIAELTLDLNCQKSCQSIILTQYDQGKRLRLTVTNNGEPYPLTDCAVVMKGVNSDGSRFASECDVNNDGTADVLTDDITFSVRGFISARFVISDALRSYNTQRFLIYVDDAFNPDITSDERFSILERLIREIQLIDEHGGILVDDALSTTSTHPVQNRIVTQAINAKMDADDATVYHVDTTTQTLTYDNTNPKTIYLNARVSYGSVSNRTAVVISTSSKGYQFAITVTGDILMRSGGGIYPTDWTVLYGSSYKKNSINDDNKNSSVFIPTIGAVVSYLVANYIGNGSGTVTENNLTTALKNSLYRVDNTTETVAYSADNPRTIYTNARVNGNKPTLIFTLGDDSQLAMHKDGHLYCRTYANGAYGSWIDLKATSIGESNKTSGAYPTVQAVYNFVTAFVASAISGKANTADVNTSLNTKEDLSNKVPNRTAMDNLNSETQYPSIKTMVQYTDEKALGVQAQVEDVKAYIGYTES
ncbi:MAG: BppU family phage baseplate upper protein, partial [Ruminococcus sp.]|nr:BppU family phage baseplate upper protein [Ruminococcus sp.]